MSGRFDLVGRLFGFLFTGTKGRAMSAGRVIIFFRYAHEFAFARGEGVNHARIKMLASFLQYNSQIFLINQKINQQIDVLELDIESPNHHSLEFIRGEHNNKTENLY